MTTIAWDGQTLAGDKQATSHGTPSVCTKVFKVERDGVVCLYGTSGRADECTAFRRWVLGEADRPSLSDEFSVMSIDQKGRIWMAHGQMYWYEIGRQTWAIGSGADYALGAMACGAGAEKAVLVASDLDAFTGFGVDTVRF